MNTFLRTKLLHLKDSYSDKAKDNGFDLEARFGLDIGRELFPIMVVMHWISLP